MKKHIFYFDHASTTPVDPGVFRVMQPYFSKEFGNPSNLYELGRRARRATDVAADEIGKVLKCRPDEIVFTGSATEADNLALAGVARANCGAGKKIIISNIEHKAIFSICKQLAREGFEIVELVVQKNGLVDPKKLRNILDDQTILISIMYANNEIGTIQPISEISKIIRDFREKHGNSSIPLFHSDAAQALQYLDCDVNRLGVDLMTFSGHKLYGPKGIGGLFVKRGVKIEPVMFGGGPRAKLHSGTENVAAIAGLGRAIVQAYRSREIESARVKKLRDKLEKGIFKAIPKVVLNGHRTKRLPNFLNISILDVEGEALLLSLDEHGITVGTGSACNSETLEPSYVLAALGNPYEYIHGSIRFTLGKYTKNSDINYVLKVLPGIVDRLRKISPIVLTLGKKKTISRPQAFVGGRTPHFLRKRNA